MFGACDEIWCCIVCPFNGKLLAFCCCCPISGGGAKFGFAEGGLICCGNGGSCGLTGVEHCIVCG